MDLTVHFVSRTEPKLIRYLVSDFVLVKVNVFCLLLNGYTITCESFYLLISNMIKSYILSSFEYNRLFDGVFICFQTVVARVGTN